MTLIEDIHLAHFKDLIGERFTVMAGDTTLEFELDFVTELPRSQRAGGGFRLEFFGPVAPLLEQGIYRFAYDDDAFDIFIVPNGQKDERTEYEAVFF